MHRKCSKWGLLRNLRSTKLTLKKKERAKMTVTALTPSLAILYLGVITPEVCRGKNFPLQVTEGHRHMKFTMTVTYQK